jgi:cell division protein FtsQ
MTSPDQAPPRPDETPRRRVRRAPFVVGIVLALGVLLSPLWLRRLDYFRVRRVEVVGARYIPPNELLDRLALDSTATVWENLKPLAKRVMEHPQVREASFSRRLPGTLVLRVVENLPVALLSTSKGLQPLDRDGHTLPLDPSRTPVDLPIVAKSDSVVLRMLDGIRTAEPGLFARVSEVRWDDRGGLRVLLAGMTVRTTRDCTAARFAEIVPVEQDLVRRGLRATELDLRFRDQIVARIE